VPGSEFMGAPLADFIVETGKRSPRAPFFYRPQMVRLTPEERLGFQGQMRVEQVVKFFSPGAISITVRVPFAVNHIEDLVAWHDLQFSNGSLHDSVRRLAEEVRRELVPYCVQPVAGLADEEAYTVFCLESPLLAGDGQPVAAEEWFKPHRRTVAALLTQESEQGRLSRQEASESTDRYLSYYENDLVVVDWDSALVVDDPRRFDETLYVLELANLQLAELEAYDRILDESLDRSYRDLALRTLLGQGAMLRELREIRVDLTRMSDELSNITKFFGDWHLARIYEAIAARFHLGEWHRTIDEKLKTLDSLYQLLQHDQNNRWMLILEATIVLLFIIDLLLLFVGLGK
jgi:hypothetical protein